MGSTANRDEAIKCISIAQRHLNAGNYPSARRFAEKSISLYPTPEAKQLLEIIITREADPIPTSGGGSASASGAEAHPTQDSTHHRHSTRPQASTSKAAANGSAGGQEKKREFTPEMAAVVKRIRKCKPTEYYEILGLTKSCEENDVKKAYKKVNSMSSFVYIRSWRDGYSSSPYNFILIRMARLAPTKRSRVSHSPLKLNASVQ